MPTIIAEIPVDGAPVHLTKLVDAGILSAADAVWALRGLDRERHALAEADNASLLVTLDGGRALRLCKVSSGTGEVGSVTVEKRAFPSAEAEIDHLIRRHMAQYGTTKAQARD